MAAATRIPVTLEARSDDWDDLTELVEALSGYLPGDTASIYGAVQHIAEGTPANLRVDAAQYDEFVAHMAEFRIDVTRARA